MKHILIVLVLLTGAPPALAAEFAQVWARHLAVEGYQDIRMSRTWLGRVRIVAEKSDREREIVINPRTGEVLRDLTRLRGGGTGLPPDLVEQESGNSGSGSSNSGSGSGSSGSGSGNSGSGSGNSGSGSSNSGSGSGNSGSGSSNSGSGSGSSGSGSGSSGSGSSGSGSGGSGSGGDD